MSRRFSLTREMMIPNGAQPVADPESSAVVYISRDGKNRPCAMFFRGKSAKPAANYVYLSQESLEKAVCNFFKAVRTSEQRKHDAREARKAWTNDYKVGDVLVSTWGYEQTNKNFYEVTAISGKMLTLREIASEREEDMPMQGRAVPLPGQFTGEAFRRRASEHGIKIESFEYAHRAEFTNTPAGRIYKPHRWTAYA
jgi:hypothetical protein